MVISDSDAGRLKRKYKASADRIDLQVGRNARSVKIAKRSNKGIKRGGGGTSKSVWTKSGGAIERNRSKF